ncbi:hypothetical protein [Sphingopyxis sp.]|uniref:hypothetical protein n=1 Tax=Sphingopyxis sp. TaxID=1908224 RepID=UPI0025FCF490|nr:hypothetical protein [Sphingopyxis sp.]MBK6414083.1 hypothetical protein [Sphingopyxis sp.]
MTVEEKREWVRKNLPLCSRFAATVAEVFGEGVRMTYASEGGYTVGKPSEGGVLLSDTVVGPMSGREAK